VVPGVTMAGARDESEPAKKKQKTGSKVCNGIYVLFYHYFMIPPCRYRKKPIFCQQIKH
jgi:hypothetical protein